MDKSILAGLLAILLVGTAPKSNQCTVRDNFRGISPFSPLTQVSTEIAGFPKIEMPEKISSYLNRKIEEPPKYDGSRRLDNQTLDEFINFIYKNMEISEIIDKKFVNSIIEAESERYVYAKSRVGARGLMQLMPTTWSEIEKEIDFYKEAFNPYKNIEVGTKYLNWINNYCEKRHPKWNELSTKDKHLIIAAAYNGGVNKLRERNWDINKMPEETKLYIRKIEKTNL